jgi:hypothetical protein
MDRSKLERRLRVSGILVLAGLVVELVTLFWSYPTAFLLFIFLGGVLMLIGMVIFLLALLASGEATKPQ